MTWKVAISCDFAEPDGTTIYGDIHPEKLESLGMEYQFTGSKERFEAGQLEGFDAVLALGHVVIDEESLEGADRLKHIARFGAGYDKIDLDAMKSRGIVVTNAPNGVRVPMAHAAVTAVFGLAHQIVNRDAITREGAWERKPEFPATGLIGKTVGIVGLGSIGAETAKLFRALGLDVVAWNRSDKTELTRELDIELASTLDEVLERADYVVLLVAGGDKTAGLINARALQRMKSSAYLVNLSRGSVVDEPALIEALRDGTIAGAALDVFEQEPLPASSPLTSMRNVILAPHGLCWTEGFVKALADEAYGCLNAVKRVHEGEATQEQIPNRVA